MNIFVGCSSRAINNDEYNRIAEEIGNFIVNGHHNFIFGGCDIGLMGKIYSVVLSNRTNSDIIIAMAKAYEDNLKNLSYDKTYLFDTVNERKDAFSKLSDIMIFIPGGIGTIDELLSAIETRRSREHNVPILIINIDHFFDHLLEMFNRIYDEKLADLENSHLYVVVNTIDEALTYLNKLSN